MGWDYHWPMIIRQVGWDVLGYTVTPLIVPLQLEGEAYDSYTGGNYEAMRGNTPVLTRCYVEYGCWWFGWSLCMTMFLFFLWLLFSWSAEDKKVVGRSVLSVVICLVAAGVLVAALTLRGAGLMDYRWTVGVNQLWLLLVLWLMRREGNVN